MNNPAAIIAVLLVCALFLTVAEIFLPSFGVIAAMAVLTLVGAVIVAYMVNFVVGTVVLVGVLVVFPLYVMALLKLLPKSPMAKRVFLRKTASAAGGSPNESLEALVGRDGVAETPLRATGAVRIDGKRYYAMAESGHIAAGTRIHVIRYDGMDLIVRAVEE